MYANRLESHQFPGTFEKFWLRLVQFAMTIPLILILNENNVF